MTGVDEQHDSGPAGRAGRAREAATGDAGARQQAAEAWIAMRALVLDRFDRRGAVSEALGMSYIRAKALRRLAAAGPQTMGELATAIGSDAPYTTVVVDDLHRRGLVERATHPDDRRVRVVRVTEAGAEAAAQAERIASEPPDVLRELPAPDLAALVRILSTLTTDG